jgi:hypothetical protein
MYSIQKIISILPLVFILILLLLNSCSNRSEYGSESDYEKLGAGADTTAPVIAEVTIVTTPTDDTTPDYTFSSDEAGIITYGGSCSSSTTSAISENNTITLESLSDGTYSDCTVTVTDTSANASNILIISSFTVDTGE